MKIEKHFTITTDEKEIKFLVSAIDNLMSGENLCEEYIDEVVKRVQEIKDQLYDAGCYLE